MAADTFGRHNVGIVYGWIFAAHQLGAAAAASAAGATRTWYGDYRPAFWGAGLAPGRALEPGLPQVRGSG